MTQHPQSVKEVKDLKGSQEQLQITKGVNGTTSLQSVADSQQDPKTLEQSQLVDSASQESETRMEPKRIFVNVQGSSANDYYGNEASILVSAVSDPLLQHQNGNN